MLALLKRCSTHLKITSSCYSFFRWELKDHGIKTFYAMTLYNLGKYSHAMKINMYLYCNPKRSPVN